MVPRRFLNTKEIMAILTSFKLERMVLLGGEPLTCPQIDRIVAYAKELGAHVKVAHSNLSILPPEGVDEMGVSLRSISKRKHMQLTGATNQKVLSNIYKVHDRGVKLQLSTILIPEIMDKNEIERIAGFLADVDRDLPLHITGYIPVPGIPWRRPTREEMQDAIEAASVHLNCVTGSVLSVRDYLEITDRDSLHGRYEVA